MKQSVTNRRMEGGTDRHTDRRTDGLTDRLTNRLNRVCNEYYGWLTKLATICHFFSNEPQIIVCYFIFYIGPFKGSTQTLKSEKKIFLTKAMSKLTGFDKSNVKINGF